MGITSGGTPPGRVKMTQELHEGHPGVNRMKALAHSFVWWPQLDSDLESLVQSCEVCQRFQQLSPVTPLQPWEWPQRPWARVHIDDAHSKWLEVKTVTNVTLAITTCVPFFPPMVSQRCWCPIMDPYLLVLNLLILSKTMASGM